MFNKRRCKIFPVLFFIIAGLLSPWGKAEEKVSAEEVSSPIVDEIWLVFRDEPFGYFLDARECFLKGDLEDAALNIRKGAAIIKLEIPRSTGEEKKDLMFYSNRLKKLAKAVEKGSLFTGADLEDAFARTEFALVRHHYQKAMEYEAKKDFEKSAYATDVAAEHFLAAAFWLDEKMEKVDVASVRESRSLARKVIDGATWGPKKLGGAMKSLGQGIKNLKLKLGPAKEWEEEQQF
ncbi:MAG: hypothetical protein ACMUJM_19000 [bacterium]